MKFRFQGRTFLLAIVLCFAAAASIFYVKYAIVPENTQVSAELCEMLGREFERTGRYPGARVLKSSDVTEGHDLPIESDNITETLRNRWGQDVGVLAALSGDSNGYRMLDITIVSSGPFGLGSCSSTALFYSQATSSESSK